MRGLMLRSLLVVALALSLLISGGLSYNDIPDRDPRSLKASQLFDMIPAGKRGSCANRPVDNTLQDAAQIADKGLSVLEQLVHDAMTNNKNNQGVRWANMGYTMFGGKYKLENIPGDKKRRKKVRVTDGYSRVTKAMYNFQAVQFKLKNDRVQGKLMCGDEDLKLVHKLGDLGLEPKDKLISVAKKDPSNIKGYFLSRYWSPKDSKGAYILDKAFLVYIEDDQYEKWKYGYCHRGRAVMNRPSNLMVLCDRVWRSPTLRDTIRSQSSLIGKPIKDDDGKYLLDQQQTAGLDMLHETFHWISWDITDIKTSRGTAYGFSRCFQLAKEDLQQENPCDLDQSLRNADSHTLFGNGVTLNEVDWYPDGPKEQG
ncbi:hypothetical protein NUU61_005201 [Penicillium alfredii]|uniref:Lysine-specific metallo-endopeptidase domain-containing protein n=1 Tax=Penicillium alfredii TaxID=1506179 RepID=A0A9W9F971_9EURO|nr:uncharacterized protein NUU61_005201 [Penicillium alfredii]KAJ5095845.1 hypothetical protein NUU61_005201 [Penicillium alfredii]